METLTDNDLVRLIQSTKDEKGVLELKIRDLNMQAEQLNARLKALSDERDEKIIEAMGLENATAAHVSTQYGVSRAWIWKLLKSYHP